MPKGAGSEHTEETRMKDPEVTSVDPTVLIDRASQPAGTHPRGPQRPDSRGAKSSEVVSVDPTTLIDRASEPAAPEVVEPTILVQRDQLPRRSPQTPHRANPATSHERAPLAVDPTVLIRPDSRTTPPRPKTSVASGAPGASLWSLVKNIGGRQRSSPGRRASSRGTRERGLWTPATRGALFAVAAIAVAAIVVLGVIWLGRVMWPTTQLLTLTKPSGGTIAGGGLECGTGGSDCSAAFREGERVELVGRADEGYAFSGFTGPCAPSGRILMSEARTCGATFERASVQITPVTWPLTITKPSGGTVMLAPDIVCGALQSMCSTNVAGGAHIKLDVQAEPGFAFLHFTGDCAPEGETTMTQARTCGATFGPAPAQGPPSPPPPTREARKSGPPPVVIVPPDNGRPASAPSQPSPGAAPTSSGTNQPVSGGGQPTQPGQGVSAGGGVATGGGVPTIGGVPVDPSKPPAPPISAEDHAKIEIQQLVKDYCSEYETLQPARIQRLFPQVNQPLLKDRFREYKSLRCTVSAPAEFDRLDASPAGVAQVKFGMKQVIQMKSGGAPETVETIVTMLVSRMDLRSPWLIDRLKHEPKPKP
jgi:Divergent InlB B-repeat domain